MLRKAINGGWAPVWKIWNRINAQTHNHTLAMDFMMLARLSGNFRRL
jgi:hypothetical protein